MTKLKIGDTVRNKFSGHLGVVAYDQKQMPRELKDCVVVRFSPASDGITLQVSSLEKVS